MVSGNGRGGGRGRGGFGGGRGNGRGGGCGREKGEGGGGRPKPIDWDLLDFPGRNEVELTKAMNEVSYNPIKTKFCTIQDSDQRRAG